MTDSTMERVTLAVALLNVASAVLFWILPLAIDAWNAAAPAALPPFA